MSSDPVPAPPGDAARPLSGDATGPQSGGVTKPPSGDVAAPRGGPGSAKEWLGYVASCFVNARLRAPIGRERMAGWVRLVNRYPRWLDAVDEHLYVPTIHGFAIHCNRRSGIGQTLLDEGQWEGLLSRTLLACLAPGDTAIDIGANIGYDTLLMSRAVGAGGLVYAFEPELRNLALLLKNVEAARDGNVVVQSLALGDVPALARITVADAYYSGRPNLRSGEAGASRPVLAGRLDTLLALPELPRIAFVKMDIEGFEFKAIQGMGALLDRVDILTCEINDAFLEQCGTSGEEIFAHLRDRGFESYCAEPVSNGRWVASGADFRITTAQGRHFDALFCRRVPEALRPLIA